MALLERACLAGLILNTAKNKRLLYHKMQASGKVIGDESKIPSKHPVKIQIWKSLRNLKQYLKDSPTKKKTEQD
jgi:hypothetical protein